jgi:hypothetical protein
VSADKKAEGAAAQAPAPVVFNDDATVTQDDLYFVGFTDGENTAPNERPDGWSNLAARRLRSMSGEATSE